MKKWTDVFKQISVGLLVVLFVACMSACTDSEKTEKSVSDSVQITTPISTSDSNDTEEKSSAETVEKECDNDTTENKPIELPILP